MMRSPHVLAIAIRKPNHRIVVRSRPLKGLAQRFPILKKPILRGVSVLIESMLHGMDALGYSAQVAAQSEETEEKPESIDSGISNWAIASSIAMAFVFGMGLFVALPHFLAALVLSGGGWGSTQTPLFHAIDGLFKVAILLLYVYLISLMRDVHRVFQYHGAEHKSIYTFEAGEELTVENARKYSTLHPRCGTSFLFFLILISVLVFSALFPFLPLPSFGLSPLLKHGVLVLAKIILMFPVAGIAYEFIKICACRMNQPGFKLMVWPGMLLQKLTTREPTDEQLEIALASLREALRAEKAGHRGGWAEFEVGALQEIAWIPAAVSEFPER